MGDDVTVVELMLLGEAGVGKTSIVRCFMNNFSPCLVGGVGGGGVDTASFADRDSDGFYTKPWKIGKKAISVKTWDSAGEEKFSHVTTSIFKRCKGAILVYDVTDPESLQGVKGWYTQLTRFSDVDAAASRDAPSAPLVVYLVGNKKDLPRKVSRGEAEDMSNNIHAEYYETSAASGEMVQECFDAIIQAVHNNVVAAHAAAEERAMATPRAKKGPRSIKKPEKKGGGGGCLLL
ncbi:vacuolar protein sorting-associated protein 21 [Pelomyxa schiedti]|nr:vacuolar protein sorting-associated protein 21 [Pelomyxa schiedti]